MQSSGAKSSQALHEGQLDAYEASRRVRCGDNRKRLRIIVVHLRQALHLRSLSVAAGVDSDQHLSAVEIFFCVKGFRPLYPTSFLVVPRILSTFPYVALDA